MPELTLTHVVAGYNSHKMTMNLGSVLAQRNEKPMRWLAAESIE
jgi:hypothetical protein